MLELIEKLTHENREMETTINGIEELKKNYEERIDKLNN
jgi:hypothetical protein